MANGFNPYEFLEKHHLSVPRRRIGGLTDQEQQPKRQKRSTGVVDLDAEVVDLTGDDDDVIYMGSRSAVPVPAPEIAARPTKAQIKKRRTRRPKPVLQRKTAAPLPAASIPDGDIQVTAVPNNPSSSRSRAQCFPVSDLSALDDWVDSKTRSTEYFHLELAESNRSASLIDGFKESWREFFAWRVLYPEHPDWTDEKAEEPFKAAKVRLTLYKRGSPTMAPISTSPVDSVAAVEDTGPMEDDGVDLERELEMELEMELERELAASLEQDEVDLEENFDDGLLTLEN